MRTAALLLVWLASPPVSGAPLDEQATRLARERGCALCHSFEPVKRGAHGVPPPAPAWRDIAARYRGAPGAEDKLVSVVMRGTDPASRHWTGKAAVVDMPPNPLAISEDEARKIVRWILRLD